MSFGRYMVAVVAVWVVRTCLNWLFYGMYMMDQMSSAVEQWEGAFREVVPAYILTDLLVALVFVWLWGKVASVFADGAKGGAVYGLVIGVLAGFLPSVYHFYSVTYITYGQWTTEIIYQLVVHVIMGVVAALLYRTSSAAAAVA